MSPQVTVVIPFYNAEKTLERAAESAVLQGETVSEIILVNNNSKDSSLQIAQALAEQHPSIQLQHCTIQSASAARNVGWKLAQTDWVQFLDADDELLPNKCKGQLELLTDSSAIEVVLSAQYVNAIPKFKDTLKASPWVAAFIGRAGNTVSNLWSKRGLERVGGWNESLESSQETDLLLRLVHDKNVLWDEQLPKYIIHTDALGRISDHKVADNWKRHVEVRILASADWKETHPEQAQTFKRFISAYLLSSLLACSKFDTSYALRTGKEVRKAWGKAIVPFFSWETSKLRWVYAVFGWELTVWLSK